MLVVSNDLGNFVDPDDGNRGATSFLNHTVFRNAQLELMDKPLRTVLITGCSSGIGRATALLLAENGYRVLAGVRSAEHATRIASAEHPLLEPFLLDVTREEDVAHAAEFVESTCPTGLYGLINNAGVGLPAAVELSTLDDVRHVLEVNTIAPLRMIQCCLPMLRKARGRVINMSSMNGTMALPMVGVYSASKFALEAISDTLRVELRPWKIPVTVIRPGQVRTEIFEKARDSLDESSREIPSEFIGTYDTMYARASEFNERGAKSSTTPEMVAAVVLRSLNSKRPRSHHTVGLDALGMQIAKMLVPQWLLDRTLARMMSLVEQPVEQRDEA
jgi:NAD(P)-dependent dehydrogenase (short-subunit alcohol dehydrogenase family)